MFRGFIEHLEELRQCVQLIDVVERRVAGVAEDLEPAGYNLAELLCAHRTPLHHSVILELNIPSYRLEQAKASQRNKPTPD